MRELTQLQAPVTGIPQGTPLDFRAIRVVASRLTQAAYEGWKKEARAGVAREPLPKTLGEPADHPHRPGSPLRA
jgi:hypothetical protein